MSDRVTRRRLLAASSAGLVTGLAGCTGGDDTEGDGTSGSSDENSNGEGSENGGTGSDGSGEGAIRYGDSYVSEIDLHEAGTPSITQTHHEGDYHTHTEFGNGEVIESYHVDGETYAIVSGNCTIEEEPPAENSVPDIENPQGETDQLQPSETTTLNGESVEVYEHPKEDGRWYVSAETGYPVQFEMDVSTVTFHSWGETEPISAPDMECLEL